MPRKPGPLGRRETTVLAVRVPWELAEQALGACGGRAALAEWMRNALRRACSVPIDKRAGYEEGYRAGWTEANARFRQALDKAAS